MPTDALPTAADLLHALQMIDQAVLTDTFGNPEPRSLRELAQAAAQYARGDRARQQALLTALAAGLRSVAGDGWRDLTGQPALDAVRRAMDEAERLVTAGGVM